MTETFYMYIRRAGLVIAGTLLMGITVLPFGCGVPPPPEPEAPAPPPPAPPTLTLHDAARQGALAELRRHLEKGADLNLRDDFGYTPLHEAASAGRKDAAEWLIQQGALIDARDESGFAPIDVASLMDHDHIVALLEQHGAAPREPDIPDAEELPKLEPDIEEIIADIEQDIPEPELPEAWKELEFLTWTSARGHEFEAVFLEVQQDVVYLGGRDGRTVRVPITQLRSRDQIRARQLAMADSPHTARAPAYPTRDAQHPRITTGFSADCERLLINAIRRARYEVLVAIYTITRPEIEQALSAAARRGVKVQVKYDDGQISVSRMQELIHRMERRGVETIPIRMSGRYASMHHKFAVIDNTQVFTGSFNFTVTAVAHSYENCVLIEHEPVARDFTREFNRIRSR